MHQSFVSTTPPPPPPLPLPPPPPPTHTHTEMITFQEPWYNLRPVSTDGVYNPTFSPILHNKKSHRRNIRILKLPLRGPYCINSLAIFRPTRLIGPMSGALSVFCAWICDTRVTLDEVSPSLFRCTYTSWECNEVPKCDGVQACQLIKSYPYSNIANCHFYLYS